MIRSNTSESLAWTASDSGSFDRTLRHPRGVHRGVDPSGCDEFVVAADFDDMAVVDDHDAIGPLGRRQAVGDQDGGAVLEHGIEGVLNRGLTLEIEVRRCLVEHEHARVRQEGSSQGEELAFTS